MICHCCSPSSVTELLCDIGQVILTLPFQFVLSVQVALLLL